MARQYLLWVRVDGTAKPRPGDMVLVYDGDTFDVAQWRGGKFWHGDYEMPLVIAWAYVPLPARADVLVKGT